MKTRRTVLTALASLTALGVLTACGQGDAAIDTVKPEGHQGGGINLGPDQKRLHTAKVDALAAKLPEAVRKRGTLILGVSAKSNPPLTFRATDDTTLIGVELDIATLVADALGLKPDFNAVSWENLFVGLDSGKYDGVFSNVTVTEERKDKYDFATYRRDDLAFEAKKGSGWTVKGPQDVSGKRIAVGTGTNQEKILVDWSRQNEAAGRKGVDIKYYDNTTDYYLALQSGRIDGYLGPNPSVAYHVATAGQTETVGKFSGAGVGLQGKIAATTKKDSGLVAAYQGAIDHLIQNGTYAQVLKRWGLDNEAVEKSEINPPGLPRTKN
ncbi:MULTISPECIES: ABC transporter substrate-binding protein [unclassified Streptomyces]|uniref:ABC transporter substrate-binding protein n=1 Tax=unclassified Streptomyces TaxID=2593676 RepID=UPI001660E6AC|nr:MULTISPECIES: ABC transporter substrate-binding protein [unclassified Streptomyces]MBD0707783.1 ABC transporter substrate-binding protein [Streptomyces sp. CBMA291]MBD0713036.1 ABC transporter substrate-binding protein [Streptomyces sp. CBMA370]